MRYKRAINASFKTRLREVLAARGIKQAAVAESIGVSQGTISKWLAGEHVPGRHTLQALANSLGVPPETFAAHEDPEISPEQTITASRLNESPGEAPFHPMIIPLSAAPQTEAERILEMATEQMSIADTAGMLQRIAKSADLSPGERYRQSMRLVIILARKLEATKPPTTYRS